MKANKLDAFVVFHGDAHQSEYLAPCDERIGFISGFNGSNGLCVVSEQKALCWTDGRYYLQADKQLHEGWEMMKIEAGFPQFRQWIKENMPEGSTVGVDGSQITVSSFNATKTELEAKKIGLVCTTTNLVDDVWATDKPCIPQAKVWHLEDKYTGMTAQEKYSAVSAQLKDSDHLLVTTLDDIAWLLNLRGDDISFNPLFFSYLLFNNKGDHGCTLFVDAAKVADVADYLKTINVDVQPYESVKDCLEKMPKASVTIDASNCNYYLYETMTNAGHKVEHAENNVIEHLKAKKTPTMQQGMRNANIRDCAAIMKYFAFLEEELKKPDHGIDEFSGARKVEEYRTHGEHYLGPSFDTISSIGANGAVIHYKPEKDSAVKLNNDEIYLLDSGGQYYDGTTDITRTAHFGGKEPTAFQKEAYTRVLMGTLGVEQVVWPSNSTYSGSDFDILARQHLFAAGLNFNHGTGHGVGSLLCVHEGPIGINRRTKVKLEEGMCVSDEPGYYKDGEFGIRIENVIMVQKHSQNESFYCFENMTTAPYCRELIDLNVLPQQTIDYVNQFHAKCLEVLTPLLKEDERALNYVKRQCAPLSK